MNTDMGPLRNPPTSVRDDIRTRRNTCSDKKSQQLQLGKSTLMVLTKNDDTGTNRQARAKGVLDRSDRSSKSDGFPVLLQDARRSSVDKSLRRRSNSCDDLEEMYAMQTQERNMGVRSRSTDNFAEMIAISRQSMLTGGSGNPRVMHRQSLAVGGQRNFDRRNTYKEPARGQAMKESDKPRRMTTTMETSTTVKVLTKKEGNPQASQFRSDNSVGSVKSDGFVLPIQKESKRRIAVEKGMGRRSSSYDNISDKESSLGRRNRSADNLAEMIVMSRQSNPRQLQINGSPNNRRNTYKPPPRNKSSDDLKARRVTVPTQRTNQPLLGKSTQLILTKKDGNPRGSPPRNEKGGLDRSNRSAVSVKSEGYIPGLADASRSLPKRTGSLGNVNEAMGAPNPPLTAFNDSRVKTTNARGIKGPNGNSNLYDTVLSEYAI